MNIGDVFFALRGDGGPLQVDAKKAAEAAAGSAGKSFSSKFSASIKQGLGMGVGFGAFQLLSKGIGTVTDALGDATQAAMADESSQVKLRTALAANVKGWDGNTDAIEKVLKARMALGFSDDDQRESLSLLVAKTGDVTKALGIQRAAMDLARFKGIALAEASKAIALGMGGSGRALKELGINVKDYANETEILAAIQAKAAGQAEKYGNTTAGAWVEANVAMGEASEVIGYKLTPLIKDMAVFIRNTAVPAVEALADAIDDVLDPNAPERRGAGDWSWPFGPKNTPNIDIGTNPVFQNILGGYGAIQDAEKAAAATGGLARTRGAMKAAGAAAAEAAIGLSAAARAARTAYTPMQKIGRSAGDASKDFDDLTGSVNDAVFALIAASFEPEQLSLQLKITAQDTKDLQKELKGITDGGGRPLKGHTWKEVNELKLQISESKEETRKLQFRMDTLNGTTMADVTKGTKGLKGQLDDAGREALYLLNKLNSVSRITFGPYRGKATGGVFAEGTAAVPFDQLAFVHRGEIIVPAAPSAEIRSGAATLGASGTAGATYQITVNNPEPRAAEADIGRVLRRTAALGMG